MQILDLTFFFFLLMYMHKEHWSHVQNWASFTALANRLNTDANGVSRGDFGGIVYSNPLNRTGYTRTRVLQRCNSNAGKALP